MNFKKLKKKCQKLDVSLIIARTAGVVELAKIHSFRVS